MSHSPLDQLKFLSEWFGQWSEYQKDDFLQALAGKLSPKSSDVGADADRIANGIEGMSTASGRPPSLFACQVKLFNDWWENWSESVRGKLTDELKRQDPKFWTDLENEMDGTRTKEFEDFFPVEVDPTVSQSTTVQQPQTENASDPIELSPSSGKVVSVLVSSSDADGEMKKKIPVEEESFKTTIEVASLEQDEIKETEEDINTNLAI